MERGQLKMRKLRKLKIISYMIYGGIYNIKFALINFSD